MSKIISFAVRKGGSLKTTSSFNVGFCLARMGKKVLMVDFDPQADLTTAMGMQPDQVESSNVYTSLMSKKLSYIKVNDLISLVPSFEDLDSAETSFASVTAREFQLKRLLDPIRDQFDYIIIDCPPSTGFLTKNALAASDYVFIPVQTQFFAVKGMVKMINIIKQFREDLGVNLKIGGVFGTMFVKSEKVNQEALDFINSSFPDLAMKTNIRKNVSLIESPTHGKDIFSYKENSTGADDYFNLTEEIIALSK
jgi:chromosome partitioning protein